MTRLACFYVPMFVLAARLRSEPDLLNEAVGIVEGSGSSAHIVAATRRARKKGIQPGQSLAQARSLMPKLIARGRDSECERTAQEALLEVAETFSPRVEDAGEGVVFLDVTGMERHFADDGSGGWGVGCGSEAITDDKGSLSHTPHPTPHSPAPELRLARAALRACDAISLPARVGIAASKLAARVAAELPKSPTVVAPGEEATFLAPLPLTRLSPELEAAAMLQRFGLASIGDLAKLPESEIASRLGEVGRELHWAARGIDPRPLMPRPLPPEFREGMELEWPLVALEPFLFIANAALDRLSKRMEIQGFACKRLEFTLTLDPEGYDARGIDLPAPTRDVKTMLTLMRLDLEKTPPGAPVVGFSFVAHPDRPRRAQLSLFGPSAVSPEKLATTIAKLVSILGDGRVGMPMTVDGHLPERYAINVFSPPPPPDMKRTPARARGLLAVRTFRPPIPIEVITRQAEGDDVQIASIRSIADSEAPSPAANSRNRVEVGSKIEIGGTVRICSGPWRIEEGWWSERPDIREYWDVELDRGGVYRVFRGGAEWFVDARYEI
ncbi:MAG TPA: DNA polymerase Y family protein [Thermoanaerobaculia bacterium]|jgi:protein ImuB|nr:DNA polymerase Y family protein [Thermoanaerobaculia bacterium]